MLETNALCYFAGIALVVHIVFKNYEPTDLFSLLVLLFLLPALPFVCSQSLSASLMQSPTATLLLGYFYYYASLLSFVGLYRVSPFHELYRYPGPFVAKLSNLHLAFVAMQGHQHYYFKNMHAKYGPIVRLGPNILSIVDVDLLPYILGSDGMPKGPVWDGRRITGKHGQRAAGILKGDLVGSRDKAIHAESRQAWNRGFTSTALKDYEPMLLQRVEQLVDAIDAKCGVDEAANSGFPEDIARWFDYFAFDLMGDFVFSGPFEFMRDGDTNGLLRSIHVSLRASSITGHIPWAFTAMMKFPFFQSGMKSTGEFALAQVLRRLKHGALKHDLFSHFIDQPENHEDPTPIPVLVTYAITAIIAGSDTTAFTLSSALYLLLKHPLCHARLRAELDASFPLNMGPPADFSKLAHLEYLNAVINETLRLFPSVMTSLQRAPTPGSEGHFLGTAMYISEQTAIYAPPYAYHRDPRYFYPEPDAFMPERWLRHCNAASRFNINAFIPFSMGPANCIGKPLALMQMRIVLATLLQAFDIRFPEGYNSEQWVNSLKDAFVTTRGSLPVVFERRSSGSS